MIKNFFTVALRSFLRQKFYSFINVIGLASGLTCALFIYLWVNDEVSKDKFHHDIGNIFQVVSNMKWDGDIVTWTSTPGPLGEEIKASIPEAQYVTRVADDGDRLIQVDEKAFMEHGFFTDADFFKIFSFKIIRGNEKDPVPDKSSVAISQKLARKLFGETDPVGKVVKVQNQYDQKVTAVFEDVPSQSSFGFDFIMPFDVHKDYRPSSWGNYDYDLYVKLHNPAQAQAALAKINGQVDKIAAKEGSTDKDQVNFYMQPFADHYLNSQYANGIPVGGRIQYVTIFSIVAIFILVIACINFMNMATARAGNRAKEVGIRKVVGAQRLNLVAHFMAEAVLISALAMAMALSIVYLSMPLFNSLVSKHIVIPFAEPSFMMILLGIVLITGILAGSYPALFLSSFRPASVLKGTIASGFSGSSLRRGLVVFQFTLTVILIASALIIYKQIRYIQSKDVGYERQSILHFNGRAANKDFEAFKNEALQYTGVTSVSRSNQVLVEVNNQNSSVAWPGKAEDSHQFFRTVVVDYDFVELMGLKLLEGRSFSKEFNDTASFILTKTAVEIMGLENPIGTKITQWEIPGVVVGVVDDFHSRSIHDPIDPIVLMCTLDFIQEVHVRFQAGKTREVVAHLEKLYKRYNPEFPFAYTMLDDSFDKLYATEKITGSLALGFTLMAIVISGLGLLGLAAYTAERKKKEISIRKTLGASVAGIVSMVSKDFLRLSLIAAVAGCPIAYYLMQKFLDGYAYHTPLGWEVFVVTALAVSALTVVTIIVQVTKAALANPVDALRNE